MLKVQYQLNGVNKEEKFFLPVTDNHLGDFAAFRQAKFYAESLKEVFNKKGDRIDKVHIVYEI